MRRFVFLLLIFLTAPLQAQARTDAALAAKLQNVVRGFRGEVGIYARNLRTGATVAINADTVFPTASMIKVPILLTLYDRVHRGRWTWRRGCRGRTRSTTGTWRAPTWSRTWRRATRCRCASWRS
jgi:hypothetical protein